MHAYYSELHEYPSDRRQISRTSAGTSRLAQPARRTGPGPLPAPAAHRHHQRPPPAPAPPRRGLSIDDLAHRAGVGNTTLGRLDARTAPAAA